MKTTYKKNIINKVLFSQIILGALAISGAIAMENESDVKRGMTMHPHETAIQLDERANLKADNRNHQIHMAALYQEQVDNAQTGLQKVHAALNNNRWIWYSGFAGAGTGMWLSTAFGGPSEISPWFMAGGVAASVIAGGVSKCMIKNCCDVDVDTYMQNTWVNVAGGLSSFLPWVGFAVTVATKGDTPPHSPTSPPNWQ